MKWLLIFICLALSSQATAANDTNWTRLNGSQCDFLTARMCKWTWDTAAGNSAILNLGGDCRASLQLQGTGSALVQVCTTDSDCRTHEAINLETSVYGDVTISDTDPFVVGIPFGKVRLTTLTGTGTVIARCH